MFQTIGSKTSLYLLIFLPGIYFHFVNKDEKMSTTTVTTNTGVQMLRLLYNTAWKKEAATQLVIKAIFNGFRGIDTAYQPKYYR